jgi:hypothetical protein
MAWVMGAKDLAMMKSGVMDPAGRDMTRVGYFLGLFWSMICIVAMVATMVFLLTSV